MKALLVALILLVGCGFEYGTNQSSMLEFSRPKQPEGCYLPLGTYVVFRTGQTSCGYELNLYPQKWQIDEYIPCYSIFIKSERKGQAAMWNTLTREFYIREYINYGDCVTRITSHGRFHRR